MNLLKSYKFFDPTGFSDRIHIIGCGSVGSTIAELLARYGFTQFVLYDFDTVSSHNIVNQMFFNEQIETPKVDAVEEVLKAINPDVRVLKMRKGWTGQNLSGYVFLCLDNIELRKEICEANFYNENITGVFDVRTGLTNAQAYFSTWDTEEAKSWLISTMNFSKEEANQSTPLSGCNVAQSVAATLRLICSLQVANFVNYLRKEGSVFQLATIDTDSFSLNTIPLTEKNKR